MFNNPVHAERYVEFLGELQRCFPEGTEYHPLYDPEATGVDETLEEFTQLLTQNSYAFVFASGSRSEAEYELFICRGCFVIYMSATNSRSVFTVNP